MKYKYLLWASFWIFSFLFIVERFFKILDNRPSHEPSFIKDTISQSIATFILWVTARHIVVLNNYLLYTMIPLVPNWIYKYYPGKIKEDIHELHMKMHKLMGILCGVEAVIHVWIIFLPCIENSSVSLLYDGFNKNTPWDPVVKSFPIFITSTHVLITWDEIFRLALMTTIFVILIPISVIIMKSKYHLSKNIHIMAMLLFTIDNIRKKSHFLAHVTTLPILIIYILLKMYNIYCNFMTLSITKKEILDESNIVLNIKLEKKIKHYNASIYYLCHTKYNMCYSLHPFTIWYNDVTKCLVFLITKQKDNGWTNKVYINTNIGDTFYCWGPYYSGLKYTLDKNIKNKILIATGTGCAFILHYLNSRNRNIHDNYHIYFTTKSEKLLKYFINNITLIDNNRINLYLTTKDVETPTNNYYKINYKRIPIDNIIKKSSNDSVIFYSGNKRVKHIIYNLTKKYNRTFISSHTFD